MRAKSRNRFIYFLLFLCVSGCADAQPQNQIESIPLAPLDLLSQEDGVIPFRAYLHTKDRRYPYFGFTAGGDRFGKTVDEVLFPTDVLIVQVDSEVTHVFLMRSPHGGCFIRWNGGWPYSELPNWTGKNYFDEPCYGSRWDMEGKWILGPSPRNMDELPFEVKDGMLWVTGEILYGETHP